MAEKEPILIDKDPPVTHMDCVLRPVPERQVGTLVFEDGHALKPSRPVVKVFLVGESAGLNTIMAPVEALAEPALQARGPAGGCEKRRSRRCMFRTFRFADPSRGDAEGL